MRLPLFLAAAGLAATLAASGFLAFFPATSTESCSAKTIATFPGDSPQAVEFATCTHSDGTFLADQGARGLAVIAAPALLSAAVLAAIAIGSPTAHAIAIGPLILLLAGCLLAAATVGLLYLPGAMFSLTAFALDRPARPPATA